MNLLTSTRRVEIFIQMSGLDNRSKKNSAESVESLNILSVFNMLSYKYF
jgi:hypothetical protein